MCFKACKRVSSMSWTFPIWKYFKTVWERDWRTCKSTKCFIHHRATYNVPFFFGFCWDGCKSCPRIALKWASPWHLSIMRAKARTIICSIEIVKFHFGSLMNTFRSNIGWMPIMPCESSKSKIWSWPSNFMKIISSNVDETNIVYTWKFQQWFGDV